ncbi:MAG: nucleotidyltransferase domain-containing protein [Gemmatimonadota bacterium]
MPELELLLAAISPNVQARGAPADWPAVLRTAQFHRLTPLLLKQLAARFPDAPIVPELRAEIRTIAQRNLLLFAHTARASECLRAHGIDALALKGPVLAHQLHGDLSLRVCGDVDLLVRQEDFAQAARVLARSGYSAGSALDDAALRAHRRRQHDLAFAHRDGTLLELHGDLAQPHYSYRAPLGAWFEQAREVEVAGKRVKPLRPEHALVLAVVHGTKHLWARLDLIADVSALSRMPLDWDEALTGLGRLGARRGGAVAGALLRTLLCTQTPLIAEDTAAERAAATVVQRLRAGREPTYWQARRFDVAVRERLGDRLRYARLLYRRWNSQ